MATTLTTNSIKYEILREEDEDGDASEEGSEIIIITPIHSEHENDNDASVLSIVLSQDNTRDVPPQYSANASQQFYQLTNNNDNLDSSISMPAFSVQPCVSSAIPPPPYEGAEGAPLASGTTTSLNLAEGSDETQNLMTLMMLSNYSINNPPHHHHLKMSPSNGADNNLHGGHNNNNNVPGGHNSLPSYDVATDLPSYEEAERTKEEEMRLAEQQQILDSQQDEERNVDSTTEHLASMAIGTDWTFLCTFIISFLFNWIGFLLSLCITSTVSGRCGALAGLGLSVVKWVAIVKQSKWASGFAEEESWLWWSLMVCGLLLFIRGCVQYIHIKYEWKKIAARIQQFYFF